MRKFKSLWIFYALAVIAFLSIVLNRFIPSMPDWGVRVTGIVAIICLIVIAYKTGKRTK